MSKLTAREGFAGGFFLGAVLGMLGMAMISVPRNQARAVECYLRFDLAPTTADSLDVTRTYPYCAQELE